MPAGGKREGAGRPASEIPKKKISITLDSDLVEILDLIGDRSSTINEVLRWSLQSPMQRCSKENMKEGDRP